MKTLSAAAGVGPLCTSRVDAQYHLVVSQRTLLDDGAVEHLLDCARRVSHYDPALALIVGSTRCPHTGRLAAGGLNRKYPGSRSYARVEPTLAPMPVDTFDPASCLLLPDPILHALANKPLTPATGLRLRKLGFVIFLAPGFLGTTL